MESDFELELVLLNDSSFEVDRTTFFNFQIDLMNFSFDLFFQKLSCL